VEAEASKEGEVCESTARSEFFEGDIPLPAEDVGGYYALVGRIVKVLFRTQKWYR
jgi:hypothetical protein